MGYKRGCAGGVHTSYKGRLSLIKYCETKEKAILLSLLTIVTAFLGVYVIKEWFWGAFPSSLINGGGFIISAYFIYRLEKHKKSVSTLLIFYGFLLNGIHNLDIPSFVQ